MEFITSPSVDHTHPPHIHTLRTDRQDFYGSIYLMESETKPQTQGGIQWNWLEEHFGFFFTAFSPKYYFVSKRNAKKLVFALKKHSCIIHRQSMLKKNGQSTFYAAIWAK